MHRYLLPRLQDFFFIVLLAGGLLSGMRMLNTDGDLGRHLTLGRTILASHEIPTQDVLSFTKAGEARPAYEWLAQALLATAYNALGLDGVVILTALVIAASFAVVYADSMKRSGAPILALLIAGWAAAASSLHWVARPHVFSFLIFAIWLYWLDRLRRGESVPPWQFPALMLVWANTHGGFVFGFIACGAYLAGCLVERLRRSDSPRAGRQLLIVTGTSLAASVITPNLWGNWSAVLNNRSSFVLSQTVETRPVNLSAPNVWPFLALVGLAVVLVLARRRQVAGSHVFLLSGMAIMSFAMIRNIPLFAIAAAPLCSQWLAQSLGKFVYWFKLEEGFGAIDRSLRGTLWSLLAITAAISFIVSYQNRTQSTLFTLSPQVFPVAAVNWLDAHPPQGNMFNDFNWGGYLLFRSWPRQRVFIDSQSDFYGEPFIRQYAGILGGDGNWEAELNQYHVDWIMVPPSAGLAEKARLSPSWMMEYEDPVAVIFERR